jgi:D-amino-acid dehydrogenase
MVLAGRLSAQLPWAGQSPHHRTPAGPGRLQPIVVRALQAEAQLGWTASRCARPGKLVVYRQASEFARAAGRLKGQPQGGEQALDPAECVALEPALGDGGMALAGGIFTAGEAVADCNAFCHQLAARLRSHGQFRGIVQATARGFVQRQGAAVALRTDQGELPADDFVIAAGLHSRELAADAGLRLPIYPLKGYSLTAPIGPSHRPPVVSVTDFEKKILYAGIGAHLRVAAMVDLVGDDTRIDPARIASLQRAVRATFPHAADYDQASAWAGLRPATPSGAPILGATPVRGLWLNAGHGALGFTFAFGSARILAALVSGRPSPIPLEGLRFEPA